MVAVYSFGEKKDNSHFQSQLIMFHPSGISFQINHTPSTFQKLYQSFWGDYFLITSYLFHLSLLFLFFHLFFLFSSSSVVNLILRLTTFSHFTYLIVNCFIPIPKNRIE